MKSENSKNSKKPLANSNRSSYNFVIPNVENRTKSEQKGASMDNSEKMSLLRLLSRIVRMDDETKAMFNIKSIYYAADKEAEEIRKEMKHGSKTD